MDMKGYERFEKMLRLGVPVKAVRDRCLAAGLDPGKIGLERADADAGRELLLQATTTWKPVKTTPDMPEIDLANAQRIPLPSPNQPWGRVISIRRSALGATGVFFVQLDDNGGNTSTGIIVVKRAENLSSALYGC